MADISKIKLGENTYNIKDKTAARKGMYVGTCSTAAATAAKVATTDPFPLDDNDLPLVGTVVAIKFSSSNSYKTAGTTMTLNVNNTGAFPIYYNNAEVVSTTSANTSACGYKNRYTFYIFNGTQWVWLAYGTDSNTTYDDYSFGLGYGVQDNASASSTVTVTLVSYRLKAGPIGVKFIYNVPANSTMNINSVGAKGIYYRGAAITSGIIKAGDLATFIYNKGDSKYHLISIDRWQEDIDDLYSTKADSSSLATVATSGSYNDLSDKPTIPSTDGLATETYVDTAISGLVNSAPQTLDTLSELADALGDDPNFATTVATQIGNKQNKPIDFDTWYTDTFGSSGLPTTESTARTLSSSELSALNALTNDDSWEVSDIPAVLEINTQSLYTEFSWTYRGTDQNAKYCYIIKILPTRTGGKYWRKDTTIELAVTSSLATVATSGSYNDLTNKPTIPAAYDDSTLSGRVTALENAGYITTETDPSVPSWAKQASKPSYTASEVGADVFIVHIEDGENENEYTCDKTNAEIYAAWQAGRSIIAMYDGYAYPLSSSNVTSIKAAFTGHLYDDPHGIDSWTIRVINNTQVILRTELYLIDESYPCAGITNGNIGAWNNKSTKVIINMSYNSSNDTVSFTDANNSALTHTLVINLLNNSTNDVLILYKYALHRIYWLLDGYYYYSVIFEYGTYSYFSLYNNNGTLILDESTFFGVADDNTVVHNGRKVNGKTYCIIR